MAARLHPDKKSTIYAEWKAVHEILERQAEKETAELRKRDPLARPVTVPEIIRRQTLALANKVLSEEGGQPLELDPGASTAAHRGERVQNGKLVRMEEFSPRKKKTVEVPADFDVETFNKFMQFMATKKEKVA